MITSVYIISLLVMFAITLYTIHSSDKQENHILEEWKAERAVWYLERKELMDRLQAGSFAEYKQAEVKVIKASKQEEKPAPTYHLE